MIFVDTGVWFARFVSDDLTITTARALDRHFQQFATVLP